MIDGRDREHLDDMLRYAKVAVRPLGGIDVEALARDARTFLAVSYALLVIGEAAARVSTELRSRLPAVPWKRVIGMRHHLAHGYDTVDVGVVVDTIRSSLPALIAELEGALKDETP